MLNKNLIYCLFALILCITNICPAADTWTKGTALPAPRFIHDACVVDGKIYVVGGLEDWAESAEKRVSFIDEYDPKADKWARKIQLPEAVGFCRTGIVNGKIYIIGGADKFSAPVSRVYEYNPKTNVLVKKTDMPTARYTLATATVNNKIYAMGGEQPSALSVVEEYDPATDKWTKKANMTTTRAEFSTGVVNGLIYAIGGTLDCSVEAYNPANDTWTRKSNVPSCRWGHSCSVVNGIIYVISGAPIGDLIGRPIVEAYDPLTDTWARKADIPTPRVQFPTCVLGGKIYAIGGSSFWVFAAGMMSGFLSSVEIYDTGFIPEENTTFISPQCKLVETWGYIKKQ